MSVVELLRQSRKQAESAAPLVRAAAKLRIARVEAVADRAKGRITLEMALEEIGTLPEPERSVLFDHARVFAAAVEPSLLPGIPEESTAPQGHTGWMLGKTMLEHGHAEAARQFVLQDGPAESFPFLFAMNILHDCEDQTQRLAVMRKAVKAWHETKEREFLKLFGRYWTVVPAIEALSILHSVVESTLNDSEWPMQGSFDNGLLLFTSGREFMLFEILHILRPLDPTLAAELIATHEQLAAGARRYPNGWDSIQQEAEEEQKRRKLEGGPTCGGRAYIGSGASQDIAFQFALQDGDFDRAMELAQELYREDTDIEAPNFAPKVLWPSAARFRSVLYHAGRRRGLEKRDLLARVPDEDLQLLARIEFAAAVAGLTEMPNSSRRQTKVQHGRLRGKVRRLPEADGPAMIVDGAPVRCPECQWRPKTGNVWGCRCGNVWNTFTSRGRCPACSYQWPVTQCMQCGKVSPHEDWYGEKEA
ncbi:hypothetical protein [Granulicella aggregans]|uniref:hypothetical protein n=1 Tax=Granulicella aggregans TaxID=474949 RepID=UPI0021E05586|nr:hypothetical protein [Granulicella aggregans]